MDDYITDKKVIEVALTQEGVNLIVDKIKSCLKGGGNAEHNIKTEWHFESEKGSSIFDSSVSIQVSLGDTEHYISVVYISIDQIYIEPIGNSSMKDIKSFIESEMISIIRERKLNQIID